MVRYVFERWKKERRRGYICDIYRKRERLKEKRRKKRDSDLQVPYVPIPLEPPLLAYV